jgi:signal transduction histidine kinase
MFERFHRIEQKGGRSFEGSGIGLALTQELVRFHGGTIRVESVEGKGTAFFVTFPLGSQHLPPEFVGGGRDTYRMGDIGSTFVDEAANWISLKDRRASLPEERDASSVALADPVSVRISDGRILVVDDNADMCRYLDSLLKPHCSVSVVHDGQQALEFLKAHSEQPDLILSDIMMSNMSGLELLRAVRAKPDTASIPFILLSARAGEEAIVDGLKSGADDYLVKPFQAGELLTRVMNHIELGRLRRDLERRVEQRTIELIHTHARLQAETQERLRVEQQLNEQYKGRAVEAEQRHRKLSEFVDTLCHEIRNPLHCMFGGVALLNESLISLMSMCSVDTYLNVGKTTAAKQNLESARKYSKSIEDAAKQQTAVVNDVLTLSRLEGRSIAVKIVPFEMCAHVENLIGMFTPQLERKNLKCSFVRSPGVTELWIKADEQHLTQILINLLSNAVKYTLVGSVTVQLAVEFLADNQLKLTITVRDTGIGMEREQLARVFEGFAPSNRRHQIVEGGSGLGLAICKRLVDVMGATIEATSQKGVGSEFTLRIACAALSESGRSELAFRKNSESTKTDIEGRRILIVDDDKTNQIVLRAYLNLKSCVTDIASNGQDAVEKFKRARFDLVFMDIEMPVMNGLDATVEIRKVELTQGLIETPVIGLSGYVDRKEAALAAGMNEFLSKPCQKDVIYDVIRMFATMHTNDSIISEFSSHRLEIDE